MAYPIQRLKRILQFITEHPLANKHKWRSILRFLYWQLSQRLYPHDARWEFTSKTKLVLRKGLIGATGNLYAGLHDFAEMGFLLHFLRPADVFADIGANAGSYTVLASGHVRARTLAFEPMPATLEWVKKNITENGITDLVQVFPVALGDQKKTVRFSSGLDAENHVLLDWEKAAETTVNVEVFDDLCYPHNIPLLAKLDVEGYETAVLQGMQKTVADKKLKAIIIELNGSGYRYNFDEKKLHEDLIASGFLPHTYDPFTRKLIALKSFGPHNTIYCRDVPFIIDRLSTAEPVKVMGERF